MWAVKLAGAVMVVAAGALIGQQVAAPLVRRPRELRELQAGLALLETEVAYGAAALPAALARAATAGGLAGRVFGGAARAAAAGELPATALARALAAAWEAAALTDADGEALSALAAVLGASDRHDQLRHLRLCRERLAAAEAAAEAERRRGERLYRTTGLLAGAAAAILAM